MTTTATVTIAVMALLVVALLWTTVTMWPDKMGTVWAWVLKAGKSSGKAIRTAGTGLGKAATWVWTGIGKAATWVQTGIGKAWAGLGKTATWVWADAATTIKDKIGAGPASVVAFFLLWVFLWMAFALLWGGVWAVIALHYVFAHYYRVFFGYYWRRVLWRVVLGIAVARFLGGLVLYLVGGLNEFAPVLLGALKEITPVLAGAMKEIAPLLQLVFDVVFDGVYQFLGDVVDGGWWVETHANGGVLFCDTGCAFWAAISTAGGWPVGLLVLAIIAGVLHAVWGWLCGIPGVLVQGIKRAFAKYVEINAVLFFQGSKSVLQLVKDVFHAFAHAAPTWWAVH
jgi:hypothetical protein